MLLLPTVRYCTHTKVIEVFQSGLVSSRDSAPNPHGSRPSPWQTPSYTNSFLQNRSTSTPFKTRIRGATVRVPPLASVLQMAEPRECSSSCSLIYWLGSRWFCICVECFTSNYSSNCSRWLPTKLYWLGIPRDLSLTCFPFDCFDFSRLVYAPFRSS